MALLPYSIREGVKGLRRASFAAAASTSAMAVALILVGVVAVIAWEAVQVADWLRERVGEVEVFLEVDVDDRVGQAIDQRIALMTGVAATRYISKAEAVEIFRSEFGEGAEAFFDAPFLPASIRIRFDPAWANPDSMAVMQERLESFDRVDEVQYNQALLVAVQRNLRLITTVGAGAGLLILIASIFLVANTIRLTIYARRLLIRTMKLVGATDSFIRRPFLIEGLVQGLIAGGIAAAVLWLGYMTARGYIPDLSSRTAFLPITVTSVVVAGMGLGWFGSYLSVRRFIRKAAVS